MSGSTTASVNSLKNVSYVIAFIGTVEYLGFTAESLSILTILMLFDILTGVSRAYCNEGGSAIRSAILRKGLLAKFLLFSGLLATALTAKGLGYDSVLYAQGIINVLMLGELFSILGNIHSIKTGQPKVEFDALTWMLNRVKGMLDKLIK
jgi:toxin secretion/phage lysis holin